MLAEAEPEFALAVIVAVPAFLNVTVPSEAAENHGRVGAAPRHALACLGRGDGGSELECCAAIGDVTGHRAIGDTVTADRHARRIHTGTAFIVSLLGVDVSVGIIAHLLHVGHAVLVAGALRAVAGVVGRIALFRIRIRVGDCLAVGTGAGHRHGEYIALLGVDADLHGVAIHIGTGLAVGRRVGRVGGLVSAQRDRLRRAGDGALVGVCLGCGDDCGTGLVGERRNALGLHRAGGDCAAGDDQLAAGDLVGVCAVGEFGGRAGKILLAAVRVRDHDTILRGGTSVALNHQTQVVTAIGDVGILTDHGVAEVVHRHDLGILPQVGARVAQLGVLVERAAAVAIPAAVLVRAVEEQRHAVLLRGDASPAVLDPLIIELLRDVRLAIGEIVMGLNPVDRLVFRHLVVLREMARGQGPVLHAIAHLMAEAGISLCSNSCRA